MGYTLLGDKITNCMLSHAKVCLVKFAADMENLYGLTSCTFNVHLMTHLADGVKNCGPLWATSAYSFESNNHMLLKMFCGTQYVSQQICDTFILAQKLPAIGGECIREDTCPRVVNLFRKLLKENLPIQSQRILQRNVSALGKGKPAYLTAAQSVSLALLIGRDVVNRSATEYNRFIVNHILYTAQSYTRSNRHHDFLVKYDHEAKYGIVLGLYTVKPDCQCNEADMQGCQCTIYNVVLLRELQCETGSLYSSKECEVVSHFLKEYVESHGIVAICPESLHNKCINLKLRNRQFLCEIPCQFYGD